MHCDGCGNPLGEDDQYCPTCGRRRTQTGMPYPDGSQMPYPGAPPTMYRAPSTSGYAIASLVLALVGGCGIGSVLAIVFGSRAKREIRESHGLLTGEGMATAGIIVGWVGIG